MNAVDLLEAHHRELEARFEKLKKSKTVDPATFNETADALAAHITVEEELFYPAVKAQKTEEILLESLEEHLSLKRVLADLIAIETTDDKWSPKMHVLAEQAEHHHKEEEDHLFPSVRKLLGKPELAALGEQMKARMDELAAQSVRLRISAQTAESATLV